MSENPPTDTAPTSEPAKSLGVEVSLSEDKRSATLKFKHGDKPFWLVTTDTDSLDALIAVLGQARSLMFEIVPSDLDGSVRPIAAFNPRWYISPDTENKFATFWIRHPGLGWSGYGFPRHEAGSIAKWLRKVTTITSTRDTQSPAASSFGGDDFLITTEGLGFYYYGKGDKRIGPNPFEQVEFDSDRAAGIVAASIVERRLEQALQSRLRTDMPQITSNLFRPSGALGPFSTKIDLAYLLGLLSDDAYKDLTTLKNIRNDFAHDLDLDSFDAMSVKDRCKNLILVDRHVGPIPDDSQPINKEKKVDPYMGLPDYQQKLADPRFRYIMSAQLISFSLGGGSENPNARIPMI